MCDLLNNGYRIGDHLVRPLQGLIEGPNGVTHVEPRVLNVLTTLAAKPGSVISIDELIENVWPGKCVEDSSVYKCIYVLRKLLGERDRARKILVTVPKRGYRLVADVDVMAPCDDRDEATAGVLPAGQSATPRRRIATIRNATLVRHLIPWAACGSAALQLTELTSRWLGMPGWGITVLGMFEVLGPPAALLLAIRHLNRSR
jgi:DNA-binding winged helix-turn-helix (wHTH) protein